MKNTQVFTALSAIIVFLTISTVLQQSAAMMMPPMMPPAMPPMAMGMMNKPFLYALYSKIMGGSFLRSLLTAMSMKMFGRGLMPMMMMGMGMPPMRFRRALEQLE